MKTTLTVLLIIQLYGLASCAVKRHYFIDEKKEWGEALEYCRTFYHDLSTFTSETEKEQFLQYANGYNSEAWIGLSKTSGIWRWAGGKVATQISWDANQPDKNCATLDRHNKNLRDESCSENHKFFCMTVQFFSVPQAESWEGALEYCRHHYDDLATLTSVKSRAYAANKISGAQTPFVWIGLHFLAGEWSWVSGYNVSSLLMNGQPQCPAKNRCGALQKNTHIWTSINCDEQLNFLCF